MKLNWSLQIALAISIAGTLISCGLTDRLDKAATTTGKIQASVNLPTLPTDCRVQEPHYSANAGDEARSVIIGERGATNRANSRVTRCGSFYDSVRSNFAAKK